MNEIAILVKNVSKCFKRYSRPGDRLKELLLPTKSCANEFCALREVSLEVPRGQTLGIVGRNGSGKSTLLQIIAGTLSPSSGQVKVNGRISALLELGSGFNPEFTGRQNVFFNGQLLGLSKAEIEIRFDDIARFADIGDFIDQPVKTYSSGMFVRLAFAVAVSVDPNILVVDEALAVGDEAFQRKCFSRIRSIQERGGTILFVSHAASSIVDLCNSAVLIDRGELLLCSTPKLVVSRYHKLLYAPPSKVEELREEIRVYNKQTNIQISESEPSRLSASRLNQSIANETFDFYDPNLVPQSTISYISRGAIIDTPYITTLDGRRVNVLLMRKEYIYTYSVKFLEAAYKVRFGMYIKTKSGFDLGGAASHTLDEAIDFVEEGAEIQVKFKFLCILMPGVYFMNAGATGLIDGAEAFLHRHIDVVMFRVQPESNMVVDGVVDFCVKPQTSSVQVV